VRILVIVNTRSGGGDAGLYDYVRVLGASGAEITMRFCDGDRVLEDLVRDAAHFDRVVAAGGDGTASSVCYATRDSRVPVLVYPAGTANLLAQNIGMPVEPRQLAHTTLEGLITQFDLGELEIVTGPGNQTSKSGFAIMAGAGYDAAVIEGAKPFKANMGAAAYLMSAVSNLAPTRAHFRIELDGEELITEGIGVLIVNFGKLQFDVPVALGADPRDGLFQVAVVRPRNVAELFPAVVAGLSGADRLPGIDVYAAARVTVTADPELSIQYDGEMLDAVTPFKARILPHAATLLLPHDSIYADRPSERARTSSTPTTRIR
jgi:diacylglycerol kinase family enzyme